MKKRVIRWLGAIGIVALAVFGLYQAAAQSRVAINRDITVFWAAEKLFVHHQNPYDPAAMLRLELQAGVPLTRAVMMLNPPTALPFAVPLGLLDIRPAIFVWSLVMVAGFLLSIRLLWILNGRVASRFYLLSYLFAPAVACVSLGQYSMIVLVGLVLFLWLHRTRPLLAGLCIPLLATKPHLLLPFALVSLIWAFRGRRYSFVFGALLGLAMAAGIAFFFDPHVFAHYLSIPREADAVTYGVPNLSSQLRRLAPGSDFLQYVPVLVASFWALWFYWGRRDTWEWNDSGLILIAISVIAAPHSWLDDEVLFIPAIVAGLCRCAGDYKSLISLAALNGIALFLLVRNIPFYSGAYVWTSVAWLVWFLYSRRLGRSKPEIANDLPLAAAAS